MSGFGVLGLAKLDLADLLDRQPEGVVASAGAVPEAWVQAADCRLGVTTTFQ